MEGISTSSPVPCHGGVDSQLLLLQFLNQLCNTTKCAEHDVQYCIQKHNLLNEEHSKLLIENRDLQAKYLAEGKYTDNLTYHLEEYEMNIEELETNLQEATTARESCERNATLQKELEVMNKGLHELRNCSQNVDGKIKKVSAALQLISQKLTMEYEEKMNELRRKLQNETSARRVCEHNAILQKVRERRNCSHNVDGKISEVSATLQLMSQKLNMVKRIHYLKILSNLTNDIIQNSTHMYSRQSWELQNERRKTQNLEKRNAQLQMSLDKLQNEQHERNQRYEGELRKKTDELIRKDEQLNSKDKALQKTEDELKSTQNELIIKDEQLKNKNDQLQRTEEELNSTQDELKTKDEQLKNKTGELNSLILAAKEQTVATVTKVIDFTNKYRKYLASGNLNFAVAVYGDAEIKYIFRLSKSNAVKQMTDEEIYTEGFLCGNNRYIPKCFKCDGTDDCGNWSDERNCSSAVFPVGARVARGPGWSWGNQDGEPPGVGTVTQELPDTTFGDWVKVKWDSGYLDDYHIGGANMDLRAAAGYFCGPN